MTRTRLQVEELSTRLVPSTVDPTDPTDGMPPAGATGDPVAPPTQPVNNSDPAPNSSSPPGNSSGTVPITTSIPPTRPEPISLTASDLAVSDVMDILHRTYLARVARHYALRESMIPRMEGYDLLQNGRIEALAEAVGGATPELRDAAQARLLTYDEEMVQLSFELAGMYTEYRSNFLLLGEAYQLLDDLAPNDWVLEAMPLPTFFDMPEKYLELVKDAV